MSDVPMHPQPPSNEDGFFGDSQPDAFPLNSDEGQGVDENSWLLDEASQADAAAGEQPDADVFPQPTAGTEFASPVEAWDDDPVGALEGGTFGAEPDPGEHTVSDLSDLGEFGDPAPMGHEGEGEFVLEDGTVGASFVEPEPATRAVSRALVPASAALLVSFSGIAAWAFMKKPVDTDDLVADVTTAGPNLDQMSGESKAPVELADPEGTDTTDKGGRVSFQREGSSKALRPKNSGSAATVSSPREPGELAPKSSGTGRPSFSKLGSPTKVESPSTAPVSDASVDVDAGPTVVPEAAPEVHAVDAEEFNRSMAEVASEDVLDAIAALDEETTLPKGFMESFVLSIDPIEHVASIYGDLNTKPDVDSFRAFEFATSVPFDQYGFTAFDFEASDSTDSLLDDGFKFESREEALASVAEETFLPFGLFDGDDETVASVEVGPEPTVVAETESILEEVAPEEEPDTLAEAPSEVITPGDAVEPEFDPEVELAELAELVTGDEQQVPEEPVEAPEFSATAAPVITLEGLTELIASAEDDAVEETPEETPEEPALELTEESMMEPTLEPSVESTVAEAVPVEPAQDAPSEPSMDVPVEPAPEIALVAEVEVEAPVVEVQPLSDLDVEAAHARLDAIFGTLAPVATAEPEVDPEVEAAPEEALPGIDVAPEVAMTEISDPEIVVPEMSDEFSAPPEEVAATVETSEVQPVEVAVSAEPEAEVTVEPEFEVAEAEVEPSAPVAPVEVEVMEPLEVTPEAVAPADLPLVAESDPEPELLEVAAAEPEPREESQESPQEESQEPSLPAEPTEVEVLESVAEVHPEGGRRRALPRVDDKGIWPNRTVPKSKVDGDRFVLTPHVGNVRVIFDGGESIDGRLHGVGNRQVVVDTKLGRMTLDARRAERIDRLGTSKSTNLRSPGDSDANVKGLDRVKVRAAGGVFYGHLVARTDEKVTLLLDGGVRVTLDATEVEPAKARKATSRLRKR